MKKKRTVLNRCLSVLTALLVTATVLPLQVFAQDIVGVNEPPAVEAVNTIDPDTTVAEDEGAIDPDTAVAEDEDAINPDTIVPDSNETIDTETNAGLLNLEEIGGTPKTFSVRYICGVAEHEHIYNEVSPRVKNLNELVGHENDSPVVGWYSNVKTENDSSNFFVVGYQPYRNENGYVLSLKEKPSTENGDNCARFDLHGGTWPGAPKEVSYETGGSVNLPAVGAVTKDGYTLVDWYVTDSRHIEIRDSIAPDAGEVDELPEGGVTIHARWEALPGTYTIYVNFNKYNETGGSYDGIVYPYDSTGKKAISFAYKSGESVDFTPIAEKTSRVGYKLAGWRLDNDYSHDGDPNLKFTPVTGDYIFYAVWTKDGAPDTGLYTATFDLDGGKFDGSNEYPSLKFPANGKVHLPSAKNMVAPKDGLYLQGWKMTEDSNSAAAPVIYDRAAQYSNQLPAANVTFTAQWVTLDKYQFKGELEWWRGGDTTGRPANITFTWSREEPYTFVNPTIEFKTPRPGYEFVRWNLDAVCGGPEVEYTYFYPGDTTAKKENDKLVISDAILKKIITEQNGVLKGYGEWKIAEAATLTAKFNPNGGSIADGFGTSVNGSPTRAISFTKGQEFKFADVSGKTTRSNFKLIGWQQDGTSTVHKIDAVINMPSNNVSFTAKWETLPVEYSGLFRKDNDDNVGRKATWTDEKSFIILPNVEVAFAGIVEEKAAQGLKFSHWLTSEAVDSDKFDSKKIEFAVSTTIKNLPKTTKPEQFTITAQWVKDETKFGTVVYDGNITKPVNENDKVSYLPVDKSEYIEGNNITLKGTGIGTDTKPVRPGYKFLGWTTESVSENYLNGTAVAKAGINTFYAQWEVNTVLVTYEKGDLPEGTVVTPPTDRWFLTFGEKTPQPKDYKIAIASAPKAENYTFMGWKLDDTTTIYGASEQVSFSKDVTLTAQWKAVEYTGTIYAYKGDPNPKTIKWTVENAKGFQFPSKIDENNEMFKKAYDYQNSFDHLRWHENWVTNMPVRALFGEYPAEKETNMIYADGKIVSLPLEDGFTITGYWRGNPYVMYKTGATDAEKVTLNGITFNHKYIQTNIEGETAPDYRHVLISNETPVREGYRFLYWIAEGNAFHQDNNKINPGETVYMAKGNVILTAQWVKKDEIVVTYEAGDVSEELTLTAPEGIKFGAANSRVPDVALSIANAPSYQHHEFAGWKLKGTETVYKANEKVSFKDDVTLVAQWNPISYPVTYLDSDVDGKAIEKLSTKIAFKENQINMPAIDNEFLPKKTNSKLLGFTANVDLGSYTAGTAIPVGTKFEDVPLGKAIVFTPKFAATAVTIRFIDYTGTVFNTQNVAIGEMPVEPRVTPKPADKDYTYTFSKWDKTIVAATVDTDYTAWYDANPKRGDIVDPPKEDGDGEKIKENDVPTGGGGGGETITITLPNTVIPTRGTTPPAAVITPETVEEVEIPQALPEEKIEEEEIPQALPEETIKEEEIPQAPGAGWALLNLILMALTAVGSVILLVGYFARKKDEDGNRSDDTKHRRILRLLSIIPAVGAVVAFVLTENMNNPMAIIDKWTILMVVIAVVQAVVMFFSKKKIDKDAEDNNTANANA